MNDSSDRASILRRVRAASRHDPAPAGERGKEMFEELAAPTGGPRSKLAGDLLDRFCRRSQAMSSTADRVSNLAEVPAANARYLSAAELPRSAVCWQEYASLDWAGAGLAVAPRAARDDDLVGITGDFCAIAETGTLMLLSGLTTAATTSSRPEMHIAIVLAARVVAGMEEGIALPRREHGDVPRAVNFVSRPSPTGDIELTIVLGAHGPYRVHLVVVTP
ncbi:MAG TPA: hypothetical protein DHV85_19345 [Candidatus Accumulibacter sp.]|nr:hypothetical protein [Accumulibacter sp.]